MIKRNPSLTDQVKSHIKEQIWANAYEDDRIPAETDLANELGVSRTTVRDALSRLENEGVVFRRQGAGTFVNRPGLQIKSRLDEIWSYEAALEAHGYLPRTRLLDVRQEISTEGLAGELGMADGEQFLVVKKLFLEDQQPVILAVNLIPLRRINKAYTEKDLLAPVFEFLAKSGDQHLSYYLSDIVPVVASDDIRQALELPAGTPLITLEEVGYNEENEPILKAYSYFRDDLLRLRLIRRKV